MTPRFEEHFVVKKTLLNAYITDSANRIVNFGPLENTAISHNCVCPRDSVLTPCVCIFLNYPVIN